MAEYEFYMICYKLLKLEIFVNEFYKFLAKLKIKGLQLFFF